MSEKPAAPSRKQEKATLTFLSPAEEKMAQNLAQLLYAHGKIDKPTVENCLRVCLYFTSEEVLEGLRRQRYGG